MSFQVTRPSRVGRGLAVLAAVLAISACTASPQAKKQRFYESGNRYFSEGRYQESAIEYRNAIQIDPRFADARLKLAESYARVGDARGALEEYVRAADLRPGDPEVQLTAGGYLLAAGRPADALARADAALRNQPSNVPAHILRGNALAGLNDLNTAVKEIEEAQRLDPTQGATLTQLGLMQLARGREAEAETALRRAIELSPGLVTAHLALAHYLWAAGRQEQAERSFREALALEPEHTLANRAMAAFCLSTGRSAEAERYLRLVADRSKTPGATFALTDYYMMSGRPRDAIVRLEPLAKDNRTVPGARTRLASAHAAAGDTARAHAILDDLLRLDPQQPDARLLKGQLVAADGRRDEALQHVRAAAEAAPASTVAQFALGRIYAARGDVAGAERAFREVLRINPRAAAAQVELAKLELASGRTTASLESAREAVRREPGSLTARLALIRSLVAAGNLEAAEREISTLLASYPQVSAVHVQKGLLAAARRHVTEARSAFQQALALEASSLEAFAALLALEIAAGDVDAAKTQLEQRLAGGAPTPELLLVAGRTYAGANDLPSAERVLRRAIDAEPSLLPAYSLLGQVYLRQRKLKEAASEFDLMAARETRPVAALTMAGMIHYAQGDRAEAVRRFEQVLSIDPHAAIAANNLAWIYAQSGEFLEKAVQLAQIAAQRMPDSPEVADTLGYAYYRTSRPDLAVAAFERSVGREPQNPTYLYHLGLAQAQAGNAAAARVALERALSLRADFADAAEARRLLTELASPRR